MLLAPLEVIVYRPVGLIETLPAKLEPSRGERAGGCSGLCCQAPLSSKRQSRHQTYNTAAQKHEAARLWYRGHSPTGCRLHDRAATSRAACCKRKTAAV